MPLSRNDQLSIVADILHNHKVDCCGTVAECQQVERLIQSITADTSIDPNLKSVLTDIYQYSQTGQYTQELDHHINSHQDQLSHWLNDIGYYHF